MTKESVFVSWQEQEIFLFATSIQIGSGAHPGSSPMDASGSLPKGCEADHSFLSRAEVNNVWGYTSTLLYAYITWYLIKYRDNFSLPFRWE
jgi:hypothetical protein